MKPMWPFSKRASKQVPPASGALPQSPTDEVPCRAEPPSITTYGDLHFYINERRAGMTVITGSQPGAAFFDQFKAHLKGECAVKFHVGTQKVENKVILNGNDLRVSTTFVPLDIEPFIQRQKQRVREEMQEAHFVEEPTDIYFIPATTLLAEGRAFPEFTPEILDKDPNGPKYFVSHRWLSPTHPDPQGKHLALLKEHARNHTDAFYWVDYSCLPQSRNADDQDLFSKTLPKIASIQAKASTIVITESDYDDRLWCHIEHLAGVFFSQSNVATIGRRPRTIEYLGTATLDRSILDEVQTLQEPAWDRFKVTKRSDIPGIKYNYRWLANLVKFQLYDRFSELLNSLPGSEVYTGLQYPQSAFGIDYTSTLGAVRSLFSEFGGDVEYFYKPESLLWLAQRFSWSIIPDDYKIDDFLFSESLFFSEDMVGWIALLLGIVNVVNSGNEKIVNLRELYAKIVLMSLFR